MENKTDLFDTKTRKQFYDDLHDYIVSELEGHYYLTQNHIGEIFKIILRAFRLARQEEKWKKKEKQQV